VNFTIRPVKPEDEEILWLMLFHAAHVHEEGKTLAETKANPGLATYVADWGRTGDLGFIAVDSDTNKALGAVWARLFSADDKGYSKTDDKTPELAIAVLPECIGQGIGTQLMQQFLDEAAKYYTAVTLNVRADNPALRLYQRLGFEIVGEFTNRVGTLSYDMRVFFT
jgi:ribosomal protein S18 acetylase RimI-like enzyme